MSVIADTPPKTARESRPRQRSDRVEAFSEMDVAQLCEEAWLKSHRFEHRQGQWYIVNEVSGIWRRDETEATLRDAQRICRNTGRTFQKLKTVNAVVTLARSHPIIGITNDRFDTNPYLLGTPAGPIDLKTAKPLASNPDYFITRSTAVTPDPTHPIPLWRAFLDQVTSGDAGLIRFLQQYAGYCLTGDTSEQKLAFLYGDGRNGKGVFVRQITKILNEYAFRSRPETFSQGSNGHPTEIAAMAGARLVYCSETENGTTWNEARIKDITGGDKLSARFMGKDFFEFSPEFKLLISGNNEPKIESVSPAMRSRFFVVPFDRKFEALHADQALDAKLEREWPGILSWMLDGCLDWQKNRLVIPAKIREATDSYFERQDVFKQWLEEETVAGDDLSDTSKRLFQSWAAFAKVHGENAGGSKGFAERMRQARFKGPDVTTIDGKSARVFRGLRALLQ